MTIDEMNQIIAESGIKQKKIAEKTAINTSLLSEYLNRKRHFETDRVSRLVTYLQRVKSIL